jgi:hypothetical protein
MRNPVFPALLFLLTGASSKSLAGWGKAMQALPEA